MLCYAFSFNPENNAKNYSQKKTGGIICTSDVVSTFSDFLFALRHDSEMLFISVLLEVSFNMHTFFFFD